jgi:flagellin
MASVINTNMASLYAQKNLSGAQNALSTSVERLSSGLRINRAKDDAAGLGISEKIKSQVTSLNQGLRNANDAISMVQTAEGSLSEVSSILQRMKELSVQARNDSLSTTQRSFISDELVALKNEINSIAERTTFNDLSLLKNSLRTDVVASSASNKLANGAAVLDNLTVSGLKVSNTNVGSYSFTAGTQENITGQLSRATTALIGTAGTDANSSIATTAASGSVTFTLSGVYEAGDTIAYSLAATSNSTGALTYTVTAEDLTANGDGTGGAVTGGSSTALNNIATKIAAQVDALTTTSVAAVTTTVSGATVKFELADIVAGATAAADSNRAAGTRAVTIAAYDVAEGNKFTLTVNGKGYSVVAGSEDTNATIAAALQTKVLADYPDDSASTVASNVLTFTTGSGLTVADMSLEVTTLTQGTQVTNQASVVSNQSVSTAATARTVTINDFDVVEGRKFTIRVGNPEVQTEYSVIANHEDTAADIASKLEALLDDNFGESVSGSAGTTIASGTSVITFDDGLNLGMSNIEISVSDTVAGSAIAAESTISSKTRAESARTITINQLDLTAGNVVSVSIRGQEYATKVGSSDTASDVAYRLASMIDDDYPNTDSATATTQFPAATRVSVTSNVITLTADAKLGLEQIDVNVKTITNPGVLTLTANADTGIGGTTQSINVGEIANGSAKTFDFDKLGVSFSLNNATGATVNAASFEAFSSKVTELSVGGTMNGEALFQIGAGTRDNVVIDGFKDIRITGYNLNSGDEKTVFDNLNTTLNTIALNTTESLSEANFATLENQIENAITTISDFRSFLGAQQNRIEFAISNIQAQSENLTAANSRIVDTDYAAETANLTKTQIMQQAATAMLAQANQMPNVILALLK